MTSLDILRIWIPFFTNPLSLFHPLILITKFRTLIFSLRVRGLTILPFTILISSYHLYTIFTSSFYHLYIIFLSSLYHLYVIPWSWYQILAHSRWQRTVQIDPSSLYLPGQLSNQPADLLEPFVWTVAPTNPRQLDFNMDISFVCTAAVCQSVSQSVGHSVSQSIIQLAYSLIRCQFVCSRRLFVCLCGLFESFLMCAFRICIFAATLI